MLQEVDYNLKKTVNNARVFSAKLVYGRAEERSKESSTQESSEEQGRNVHVIAQIQCVHVRSLPVYKEAVLTRRDDNVVT